MYGFDTFRQRRISRMQSQLPNLAFDQFFAFFAPIVIEISSAFITVLSRIFGHGLQLSLYPVAFDTVEGVWLLRPSVGSKPGPFKKSFNFFNGQPRDLGHGHEDIDDGDETPAGKEYKGTPVVGIGKKRWCVEDHGVDEEPVQALRQSTTKRSNSIGPEFAAKYIWEREETW